MDIARLVLDFTKVLVWPLVVLFIAYGFRDEVRGLLRRVRNLSAVGVDAEFSEAVEVASAGVEAAVRESPPSQEALEPASGPAERQQLTTSETASGFGRRPAPLTAMAFVSPDGAMMAAWRQVESKLSEMVPNYEDMRERGKLFMLITRSEYFFPRDISGALQDLKRMRNEVTHVVDQGRIPSPEAAAEYVESCQAMVEWLDEYRRSPAWESAVERLRSLPGSQ
ncbi:hypothetical protein ACFV2N_45430 [Streptomyces sp. NPDC059680]|uniref:hypothetical protein n=1 Tax=Streptomyces sp. NPDC059680 TaxID=3346904 RepID=UPI0036B55761